MSSSEDEVLLLYAVVKSRKKRLWVHEINKRREQYGEYHRLCRELQTHEDRFFKYFRMSRECFEEIHDLISPGVIKCTTNWRRPISTKERLAVCLRYLATATGDSHQTIAFSFRMGRSTVAKIVEEVCKEIWNVLHTTYLSNPTEETWRQSEIGFRELCGNFQNSTFYREFIEGKTILPPKPLPGTARPVPHVVIGDEGFGLQTYLMRPFPRPVILNDERKKIYNLRLSRARWVVENAFGILVKKWRIFLRPIDLEIEAVIHVVKATCCLHNYPRVKQGTTVLMDTESETEPIRAFAPARPTNRRATNAAFEVREIFVDYFNN